MQRGGGDVKRTGRGKEGEGPPRSSMMQGRRDEGEAGRREDNDADKEGMKAEGGGAEGRRTGKMG